MPRGRPRRESTGSTASVDSSASPRRRRAANWNSDNATRLSRSSLDVLLAWFTAPGNYSRWTDARSNLKQRLALCHEINVELRSEGITHRQDMDIYAKFGVVERSFLSAKKWLEETALLPTFLEGKAGKEIEANVRQLCPHYKVLAPAFAASKNESAAATVVDIDDDDSDGEEDDDDDEGDDEGDKAKADHAPTKAVNGTDDGSDSDETQLGADDEANASLDATAATASSVVVSASADAIGAFELSESSQPAEQSIVRDSASTPSKSQDGATSDGRARTAVLDDYEETKENEPEPQAVEARRSEQPPPQEIAVRSPPKQFKRLRQRMLPQPQLTDDELSSPSTPANFKPPRARKSSLTPPSAPKSSASPAKATGSPARTPLGGSTPRAKQSIAPKRKTSGSGTVTLSSSASSSATPPSARKKQKTASPVVAKPLAAKRASATTGASKSKSQPPAKKTATPTKAAALHPDELAAILRASEEEREQRNALFALQCDKLMQELEEKKVQVVYETAVARKKLLDLGVEQSEVDRILPL